MTRKTRTQEARTESLPQRRVLVLHGPNLNLFSSRDPISGEQLTLADVHTAMESRARADGVQLESFQSNHEGALIERVHAGLLGAIGLAVMATGLFALALLPSSPTDLDIIWRMILCGAGFGLFPSPNNHTIITSALRHRSGGASGMLGTARLLGQSSGAALVALMFNLAGQNGNHIALLTAGTLATIAAIISGLRITQPRVQA